jgi:chromosome segregation ATPase
MSQDRVEILRHFLPNARNAYRVRLREIIANAGVALATLDLDQVVNRLVQLDEPNSVSMRGSQRRLGGAEEAANSVLALVSEAAASIRQREQQAASAVARAHDAAKLVKEQLRNQETRADRAEAALRQAKGEIAELTSTLTQANKDIELLHSYLAAKDAELATAEQRALSAEQRGGDAEAAIQRIVEAIRQEFSVSASAALEQAARTSAYTDSGKRVGNGEFPPAGESLRR